MPTRPSIRAPMRVTSGSSAVRRLSRRRSRKCSRGNQASQIALASALQEGYATASTDTGHVGGNASFAIGHPEKVVDFAYRAVHEMAVKSKAIVAAFYDRAPRFSYWTGCSTGGRQAPMEVQRYRTTSMGLSPALLRTIRRSRVSGGSRWKRGPSKIRRALSPSIN